MSRTAESRKNKQRAFILSFLFIAIASLSFSTFAKDPVNQTWRGIALKGYDAVAYFQQSKPVKGDSDFSHKWNGATWYFASADSRDAFAAEPESFAPQYGGYCAWAVSQGYTANIDPKAWKIVDDKLYLNYSADVQSKWEKDIPGFIEKADGNWPKVIE